MQCGGRTFLSWGVMILIQWNLLSVMLLSSRLDDGPPRKMANARRSQNNYSNVEQHALDNKNSSFVLPKRLITVFGTENSGSTFVATALGIATGAFHPTLKDKSLTYRTMDPTGSIEVQHISLPTGWGVQGDECISQGRTGKETPEVDVLVPEPCLISQPMIFRPSSYYSSLRTPEEMNFTDACRTDAGLDDFVRYPGRFFLNITSHIQWYQERGVEATAVLMARDSTISQLAKIKVHCPNRQVAKEQNERAREFMREALVKLDSSTGQVILVSYEGVMGLKAPYLFGIYQQLGINSTYVPDFRDGNQKYVVSPKPPPRSALQQNATHGSSRGPLGQLPSRRKFRVLASIL